MKTARTIIMLAACLCVGLVVDIGTAPADGWARSRKPHVAHLKAPHIKKPHAPRARRHHAR